MDSILLILLIVAVVKFVFFGGLLSWIFRGDIGDWWAEHRTRHEEANTASTEPVCMYCGSPYAIALDEGQSRWEESDLVLVTAFQCRDCELPFWHVERVPVGSLKS